jgi:hypothetical protein
MAVYQPLRDTVHPSAESLPFRCCTAGVGLTVDIDREHARSTVHDGEPLAFSHYGESDTVRADAPGACPSPPMPSGSAPKQPPGQRPTSREGS